VTGITTVTICPSAPLLVAELGGARHPLPELRTATAAAVAALVDAGPDLVTVVGPAPATARWPDDAVADFGPFFGAATGPGPALPLSLAVGAALLHEAGHRGATRFQGIDPDAPPSECVEVGRTLADAPALLVVADGSARRSLKAPGWFDPRAEAFDAAVEHAIGSGDLDALLDLDADLGATLLATGRSSWQAVAAATDGRRCTSHLDYAGAPFGVGYLVARLRFRPVDQT
jgi:hypothetical protein